MLMAISVTRPYHELYRHMAARDVTRITICHLWAQPEPTTIGGDQNAAEEDNY
jgi:hypothetical protein